MALLVSVRRAAVSGRRGQQLAAALVAGPLCLLLAAPAAEAQETARPLVEITPGKTRAFRAAVQRFADTSVPQDSGRADRLRTAILEALEFTGVLIPLPEPAYLGEMDTAALREGPRSDCPDWSQSGADALVEGTLESEGAQLFVEFRVWDVFRCRQLLHGRFRRPPIQLTRLARAVADDVVAAFTGTRGASNTEIAFVSTRSGRREIFVMDALGTNPRSATRSDSIKAFPDWLPDASGILYTSYQNDGIPGLFMSSRGDAPAGQILTSVLPQAPKYRGVFDPSGEFLAMVASIEGEAELFSVRRDGRKLKRLTRNSTIDVAPTWSPDGTSIAFVSDRSGAPQIYLMGRDGSNQRRLTYQGSYNTSPAWSPDGRWIAYQTRVESQFDIWLVDPTGSVEVPLITHPRSDETPSWSPDGRKIVFSSTRRGRADLYVIDASGHNLRRLTQDAGENTGPSWGPFPR
jgi:TolB protein